MYRQGNYTAPLGQGPYTNTPPLHQRPPAPPPPPPISQGPHPPLPSMIPQGLPTISSQVGHLGQTMYSHASPGLPQQVRPNSSTTNNQPYLNPAPPPQPPQPLQVHGTSQMQQHSHWTPNAPFIPPTGLPLAPRVLPPPPSQGHTLFGNQVCQPAAGSRQAPGQPHPQASRFYASSPVGSFEHLIPLCSNAPAGPPPLPSSLPGSPPLPPPSSPPSSSSNFPKDHRVTHIPASSESTFLPSVISAVSKSNGHEMSVSGSVGGVSFPCPVSYDVCDGDMGSNIVSAHGENDSSELPPAPPKPADGKIVRSIELLCQFIAKNGPEFENMTRLKEFENPKFKFLFGGEPGSEAAVAHEYFVWTKRKYHLEFKSVGKLGSTMQSEGFSSQQGMTTDGGVPSSPADSDMDMEDDITHPLEEPQNFSSEKESHETVSLSCGYDKELELQPSASFAEQNIAKDAVDENFTYSQHSESGIRKQKQGSEMSSDQDVSIIGKSFTKVNALNTRSSGDVGLPITVNKTVASHERSNQPRTSVKPAKIGWESPNLVVEQGASPFRLLSDYASDGSSADEDGCVDVGPKTFVSSVEVGSAILHTDEEVDLGTDLGTERVLQSDKELEQPHQSSKSHSFAKSESVMVITHKASITGKSEDLVDDSYGNQESLKDDIPHRKPQQIVLSRDNGVGPVSSVEKNKGLKNASSMLKVDEFGRLAREDDSDSDLVGSPRYSRRKRDRSRSKSRSPYDRRRRRSPHRRNERRGRSRSFSPKRRRSRSKSPPSRRGYDAMRKDKRPECFDFVKGKCYRGTSCRYLHHEEKSDNRSRSYRSKQQFQDPPHSSRTSDGNERFERPCKKPSREINEGRNSELKPVNDLPITEEKKSIKEVMDGATSHLIGKSGNLEPSVRLMIDPNAEKAPGDTAHGRQPAIENSELQQSQCHLADQFLQHADHQHQQTDTYPGPASAHLKSPSSITNQLPTDKTQPNDEAVGQSCTSACSVNKTFESENISAQYTIPKESVPPVTDHLSKLPPSFLSDSQVTSSSLNQEMAKDSNLMSAAKFPSGGPVENFPPHQASVSYTHTQFSFPANLSWNFLPPPPAQLHPPRPAFVNATFLTPRPHSGPAVHLTQNMLPERNDFYSQTSIRPFLSKFPHPSSVGQNQGFPSLQEPNRPPSHLNDQELRTIAASQPITSKSHGGPGLAGEDNFSGLPGSSIHPSSSCQESLLSKSMPFSEDSLSKTQSFPGENLPPGELSTTTKNNSCSQQPSYILQYLAAGGVSALHDERVKHSSSLPIYTSDFDRNQPSMLSNYGISRISNHFNPYASTFEQPLNSRFSSNLLVQEKDKLISGSTLGSALSQVPGEGRGVASLGSFQPVEGLLLQHGSDQYDPLFDSIEPSLNSVRKSYHGQKRDITDESDDLLRFSGSNKPLDEEEKKWKVGGASEASGSLENDEYGETADAEVGAVESGSPSNRIDATNDGVGEVEIDQNSPGKGRKSKESRSMKLFKVAIANFVKEVLKPSWRQGNMSKEAFKTIVKKTVDRVSGAMKSHQIPKSQAKINHYIDSSQRKLTKLVMGYVDKYVKV